MKFEINSDSETSLETPFSVEYLDGHDPSQQFENELSFLNLEMSLTNKIKLLVKILKRHPNPISFLEDIIRKQEVSNSTSLQIDSFPNLSLAAKEFGKIILGDQAQEWPCVDCMEIIKFGTKLKEDRKSFELINLEINRIEEPLSNCVIDDDTPLSNCEIDDTASVVDTECTILNDAKCEESSNSGSSIQSVDVNNEKNLTELDLELLEANLTIADLGIGTYECEICKIKTKTYKKLLAHLRKHRDFNLYECERCGKEFYLGSVYREHSIIYQVERPHLCDICGKSFKTPRYLSRHKLSHLTERILPCKHCDKKFCHQKGLQAHYSQYHDVKTCKMCGVTFKNSNLLHQHMKVHREHDPEGIGQGSFYCVPCKKIYATKVNLKLHIKNVHKRIRPHTCSICNKSFFSTPILRSHMQAHVSEKSNVVNDAILEKYAIFKCDECDRTFTTKAKWKEHKTLHSGLKEHSCEFCGKTFAFRGYLQKHIRLLHNTAHPKNFVCKFCEKVSLNPSGHNAHMLTHTGETPYCCTICDSKFRYHKSLRLHIKNKHNRKIKSETPD